MEFFVFIVDELWEFIIIIIVILISTNSADRVFSFLNVVRVIIL